MQAAASRAGSADLARSNRTGCRHSVLTFGSCVRERYSGCTFVVTHGRERTGGLGVSLRCARSPRYSVRSTVAVATLDACQLGHSETR